MQSAGDFTGRSEANAASALLRAVPGPAGGRARSSVGVFRLPKDATVELHLVADLQRAGEVVAPLGRGGGDAGLRGVLRARRHAARSTGASRFASRDRSQHPSCRRNTVSVSPARSIGAEPSVGATTTDRRLQA